MLINDAIGEWGVNGKQFQREVLYIDSLKPKSITLYVNSLGGSVTHALDIYNALTICKTPINVIIYGYAYSAAGWCILPADTISMMDNSSWMCHMPSGSDNEAFLATTTNMIAITLANKSGKNGKPKISIDRAKELMAQETFYMADDMYNMGLCDKITPTVANAVVAAGVDEKVYNIHKDLLNSFVNVNKQEKQHMVPKKITDLFNLVEGSSPEEVVAGIASIKNQVNTLNVEVQSLSNKLSATDNALTNAKADLQGKVAEVADLTNELSALKNKYSAVTAEKEGLATTNAELVNANTDLRNKLAEYENQTKASAEAEKKAKAEALVNEAVSFGKINAENAASWIALAEKDFELCALNIATLPVNYGKVPKPIALADDVQKAANAVEYFRNLQNSK